MILTQQIDVLDTAGADDYSTAQDDWISQSDCFILTYAISDRKSYDKLTHLRNRIAAIKRIDERNKFPMVLVGNMKDKDENQRHVSEEEGKSFSETHGVPFTEASAFTGENIEVCY